MAQMGKFLLENLKIMNGYFEYNNKRYNESFDNGKLLSNDKSILSKNKIWKKRNYNKCKYE